jgi:hypothetical protein
MWTVYERLGDDGHIEHESAAAPEEVAAGNCKRVGGGGSLREQTYGMLSVRYLDDSVTVPCIFGEESIDRT